MRYIVRILVVLMMVWILSYMCSASDTMEWRVSLITEAYMAIYCGQPQSVTRNFFNGPWKYAGALDETATSGDELDAPFTLIEGQRIWCYARILREDGRLSGKFREKCTVSAGI